MKGWLLIASPLVLLVANAVVWFVVAQGWPWNRTALRSPERREAPWE